MLSNNSFDPFRNICYHVVVMLYLCLFLVLGYVWYQYRRYRKLKQLSSLPRGSPTSKHLQPYTRTIPIIDAPLPGNILCRDFRTQQEREHADYISSLSSSTSRNDRPLRVLNWNIERGFKLPQLIKELKAIQPQPGERTLS